MGIYKNLNPEDVSLRSFEVHKEFTFTNNDSGSSVYGIRAISGSTHNFQHSTANSQSFGTYNSISASMNKQPYLATFYEIPVYFTINNLFYRDLGVIDNTNVDLTHWEKTHSLVKGIVSSSLSDFPTRLTHNYSSRILHESASIISVPRKFYGEGIKPKSVTISDNSTDITYTLKDDGLGNLYDNNYSSSFAVASESFKSGGGGQVTGSIIGNILYDYGLVVITDTGSYKDVGNTSGADNGWEITFKSTRQIYEREVQCNVSKGEFMHSTNITLTPENKGAFGVPANLFPENETYSTNHLDLGTIWPASSSYNDEGYYGTGSLKDFATGSDFAPYVTTIGLYDDHNDLVAIGKVAKPIKNDKELDINFVVRFDG